VAGPARSFGPGLHSRQPDLNAPLQFERFEPYVIPKVSLTGQSTERTDVRVLQVVYSFDPAALPVYVGQQMDVFIQAPPIAEASTRAQPRPGTGRSMHSGPSIPRNFYPRKP
jgi:HlyD family secretion protein